MQISCVSVRKVRWPLRWFTEKKWFCPVCRKRFRGRVKAIKHELEYQEWQKKWGV